MQLSGKVIVITGAFGALGRALAREVEAQGATCALIGRSAEGGAQGMHAWAVDLASTADTARCFDAIASKLGRIDGLANVAGGFRWETLAGSSDLSAWSAMHEQNLLTCVNACRSVLPHMQRAGGGRIVNVGAMGAMRGVSGMGPYAASKAGVMRFTESLADEMQADGIAVNAVLPSIIDTPRNRADMPGADRRDWVMPEAIAKVMCFLLSDAAGAVNGALVPVTGRGRDPDALHAGKPR